MRVYVKIWITLYNWLLCQCCLLSCMSVKNKMSDNRKNKVVKEWWKEIFCFEIVVRNYSVGDAAATYKITVCGRWTDTKLFIYSVWGCLNTHIER